ncbi:IucA/IucC family C-terminal-domain containing protein [Paenibacillus alkalitolerans]|uniref:IucA/IucC family C-terminal-domain containing protein n=1 Tax=Paenibacillus alkalitolerans TaxID=2799335 RepID=UPI0018F644AB|nr:IucA/IucC family C-terminal-domain containing protein [Paenibacillus alkalitolerans]
MTNKVVSYLEHEELNRLFELRLTDRPSSEPAGSIAPDELLSSRRCASYLDELTVLLKSPSRAVTASQLSKRYAFAAAVPALYAMVCFHKGLEMSIENCRLESKRRDDIWLPHLRLTDWSVNEPNGDRRKWRDELLNKLFAEHLSKVWHSISAAAKVPLATLWENTAVYVHWLYEKLREDKTNRHNLHDIENDFRYFIHEAPGFLFGETYNPLKLFYTAGDMRKTCCLYYQLSPDSVYCAGCPKQCVPVRVASDA